MDDYNFTIKSHFEIVAKIIGYGQLPTHLKGTSSEDDWPKYFSIISKDEENLLTFSSGLTRATRWVPINTQEEGLIYAFEGIEEAGRMLDIFLSKGLEPD